MPLSLKSKQNNHRGHKYVFHTKQKKQEDHTRTLEKQAKLSGQKKESLGWNVCRKIGGVKETIMSLKAIVSLEGKSGDKSMTRKNDLKIKAYPPPINYLKEKITSHTSHITHAHAHTHHTSHMDMHMHTHTHTHNTRDT